MQKGRKKVRFEKTYQLDSVKLTLSIAKAFPFHSTWDLRNVKQAILKNDRQPGLKIKSSFHLRDLTALSITCESHGVTMEEPIST